MIRFYHKNQNQVIKIAEESEIKFSDDLIWVDLCQSTDEEIESVENVFNVEFLTRQKQTEIEISSRYMETINHITANINFLEYRNAHYVHVPVTFIVKDNVLFTHRESDIKAFADTVRRIKTNYNLFSKWSEVLLYILETRIDSDADQIEQLSRDTTVLGRELSLARNPNSHMLINLSDMQEIAMMMRESIIDKQRVVSAMLKSSKFNENDIARLRIIIKDIASVLGHIDFNFERLEYIQNTLLGLISIEQNKIIKIFTVASLIFMPPTLIASIYGMNFHNMPEISMKYGYPFSIVLMIISILSTLFIFKRNKWL